VNDYGEVVGAFFSPTGEAGFTDIGAFAQINAPNAIYTYVTGVNDSGELTGWYLDSNDRMHSFLATPTSPVPEAASFVLIALGCGVLCIWTKRRRPAGLLRLSGREVASRPELGDVHASCHLHSRIHRTVELHRKRRPLVFGLVAPHPPDGSWPT
jgi:hypothetical protein